MTGFRPSHFKLHELVPPETYHALGDKAWMLLDERLLRTLDQLRDHFGPLTVNNWYGGGDLHYCGFRPDGCKVGVAHSQHRYGRAADCHFARFTAQAVRDYVLAHHEDFPYITAIEDGTSWFHCDVRNVDPIMVFSA